MRAVVAAAWVVVVGCGAKPPEPLRDPEGTTELAANHYRHLALAQEVGRPRLDISPFIPDPSAYGRWPLTVAEHPALEPHFDIASALAQTGITWLGLCERGAQHRNLGSKQNLSRYLEAWCDVAKHDTEAALYELGTLKSSAIFELADATKFDTANILVEQVTGSEVEQLLRRSNLLDVRIADITAAAYFEAGHREDAYSVNLLATALDRDPHESVACERMARGIVDADPLVLGDLVRDLSARAKATKSGVCNRYAHEMACWYTPASCEPYFADQQLSPEQLRLFEAYQQWPTAAATSEQWTVVAQLAIEAEPVDQAIYFAVPALETSVRTSVCRERRLVTNDVLTSRFVEKLDKLGGINVSVVHSLLDWTRWLRLHATQPNCLELLDRLPSFGESLR